MAKKGTLDQGSDGRLLVGVELVDRLKPQSQAWVLRAPFFGLEKKRVCAGGQRECEVSQYIEGGLTRACFVAPDVGDVDADALSEGDLSEAAILAEGDESGGEVHGVDRDDGGRLDVTGHGSEALT